MKILIAIVTCHQFVDRANSQRKTWVQDVPKEHNGDTVEVRFFLGRGGPSVQPSDECSTWNNCVMLDVDDGYRSLPQKTQATFKWAIENGFDFCLKADDDSYIAVSRLLDSAFKGRDYAGRLRGPSGNFPAPYASGFGYWVSARAMRILAEASIDGHLAEDRWVGNVLLAAGIRCELDDRYVVVKSFKNMPNYTEAPRPGNRIIAACEFDPAQMARVHAAWKGSFPSVAEKETSLAGEFEDVAVLIKTFLRDGFMLKTVAAIEANLPGMQILLVDDGRESREKIKLYSQLRRRGHVCLWLPFDSGFGAKANAAIPYMTRPYTLIGSDDFDFMGRGVTDGIRKMVSVLKARPDIGSAAGHVDNNPYEGFIEYAPTYFREIRLNPEKDPSETTPDGVQFYQVDITVNYNLVRSSLLRDGGVRWVENKIGGDHFDFYHDLRMTGAKVAWVPGVNINQQRPNGMSQDPKYGHYRARAKQAIPGFLRKHGIEKFIGFDGREERA